MDKVILTKAQAQVIERFLQGGCTREGLVHDHIRSGIYHEEEKALRGMPLDTFIRALYIGYEVKLTMEERMKVAFEETTAHDGCFCGDSVAEANGFHAGFITALKIAGIEVPDITD
ncbi:MAG: hypothetical protein ACQEXV_23725 [Bacillota bacterium]